MAKQWFAANKMLFLSGIKHDWGQGSKMEMRAWRYLLCFLSVIPHCSLENDNSYVTHSSLCPHTFTFTVSIFSSHVCQWGCWQQIRVVRPFFVGNTISQGWKGHQWLGWAVSVLPALSQLLCLTRDPFQYLFSSVAHRIIQLSSNPVTLIYFKYIVIPSFPSWSFSHSLYQFYLIFAASQ